MVYQCIGQTRVRIHANDKGELIRCTNESETPSNPAKPEWGYLCESCAGTRFGGTALEEGTNVGAMQADPEEYRDQIASGFANGARRSYDGGDNGE